MVLERENQEIERDIRREEPFFIFFVIRHTALRLVIPCSDYSGSDSSSRGVGFSEPRKNYCVCVLGIILLSYLLPITAKRRTILIRLVLNQC